MHYILIDYENVQPDILPLAEDFEVDVTVFVGPRQRVNAKTDEAIYRMDTRAEIIKVSNAGPNALDFHLAFHLGQLVMADPTSTFEIISNDKGYDSLVRQLAAKGVIIQRTPGAVRPDDYELPAATFVPYHLRRQARPQAQPQRKAPEAAATSARPGPSNSRPKVDAAGAERTVASLRSAIRTLQRRLERQQGKGPAAGQLAQRKSDRLPERLARLRQQLQAAVEKERRLAAAARVHAARPADTAASTVGSPSRRVLRLPQHAAA